MERPEFKLRFCFTDGKIWCKCITSKCAAWNLPVTVEHQSSLSSVGTEPTKYLGIYKVVVSRSGFSRGGCLISTSCFVLGKHCLHVIVSKKLGRMLVQWKKKRVKPLHKPGEPQCLSSTIHSSS